MAPLWASRDGRLLVARVSHIHDLFSDLFIYVLYAPAKASQRPSFFSELAQTLHFDHAPSDRCLFLGDFNHNIYKPAPHVSMNPWFQWLQSYWVDLHFEESNGRPLPTFQASSTIDYVLLSHDMASSAGQPLLHYVPGRDHVAVSISIAVGIPRPGPQKYNFQPKRAGL
ncbi:hypothetical protein BX666DRAFT_2021806 [Dichotomocladium elegans]|nr:hypothetical protein BX666DRAFT_2021806 [Dichotomocladium elegans]